MNAPANTPTRVEFKRAALMRAVDEAASAYMNGLAPHLPPQFWMYDHDALGPVSEMRLTAIPDGPDAPEVAEQWAQALGLEGPRDDGDGTITWTGMAAPWQQAQVWCVTDREKWERRCHELRNR